MHLIPLLNFILYILCEKILLAMATSANNEISNKVASSSLVFSPIRSSAIDKTMTSVTKTTNTTTTNISTLAKVRSDLLCNSGSEFVCVCQQNAGNLLKHYILCNELIELEDLPVIEMNIRRVNLSARLHTNETYESYFKRRIAAVISKYCEQQADECMATTLRLKKENVVLLSVKPSNLQSTTVDFVITKSQRRTPLSPKTILDSNKVKYVLSAQLAALSRILGGVFIEQIEMAVIEKHRDNYDAETVQRSNSGLLLILFIIATFLIITYIIAAIRVCRDCYAKRQAKNASKLNNTFKPPNYGTCVQPMQSEMDKNDEIQSTVKMRTSEENDPNTSNLGEIAIMNEYQMNRMFQCDPSQLPAEILPLSPSSNDFFVIFTPKSLTESKPKVYGSRPKHTVHQLVPVEEKKNFPISYKIDRRSQENENIVEVSQKHDNTLAKNKHYEEESPNYDSNSTSYFRQSEYEFSKEWTKQLPTSVCDQLTVKESLQPTRNQSETILDIMNSNLERPITNEQLEATWNQSTIRNKPNWSSNTESRDKSCKEINPFPESSLDEENYNKTINSELYQSSWESKRCTETEIAGSKRISPTGRLNYFQEPEPSSNYFAKNDRPTPIIQKSKTIHQFNDWSSESDDETDMYHKLSEIEEETEKNLELTTASYAENVNS